jgi:hypothetical protein
MRGICSFLCCWDSYDWFVWERNLSHSYENERFPSRARDELQDLSVKLSQSTLNYVEESEDFTSQREISVESIISKQDFLGRGASRKKEHLSHYKNRSQQGTYDTCSIDERDTALKTKIYMSLNENNKKIQLIKLIFQINKDL